MVLSFAQLYWEVIRQLFLLLLAKMNTGQFTSLLAIYIIMSDVHIAMAWYSLVFLQFPKVCLSVYNCLLMYS
jgi:hypothetical protein